jgi:hypothetical protein
MGFFSGQRLVPIYLNQLRRYGFEKSLIPAKLHVAIWEECERSRSERADGLISAGSQVNRVDHMEAGMAAAGDLVALMVFGPSLFDRSGPRNMHKASEMVEELAEQWLAKGKLATFELRVLRLVHQAGFLAREMENAFAAEVARQKTAFRRSGLAQLSTFDGSPSDPGVSAWSAFERQYQYATGYHGNA